MRDHVYFVYMLASRKYGTLYIGVTNDLRRRVEQHRIGVASKFTAKYRVFHLVWYEVHHDINVAIQRETSLEKWRRDWKTNLSERGNPFWSELYSGLIGAATPPSGGAS